MMKNWRMDPRFSISQVEFFKEKRKGGPVTYGALERRDLVAVAFAGDNVVQVRPYLSSRLLNVGD
jgi:hypothetical protein